MIVESKTKHFIRKAVWNRIIGFIITFIITLMWFGHFWDSLGEAVLISVVGVFYYIAFEWYWDRYISPGYRVI